MESSLTEQELIDLLVKEHPEELAERALIQSLILPGNEEAFLRYYFPHRLDAALEDFHMRLIDTALYVPRGLVLFPAGHGKTTLISELLPILRICRDPNCRGVIIQKNDDDAASVMSSIKAEMESNEKLIADWGPFKPDPNTYPQDEGKRWQSTWIDVHHRTRVHRSPTIAAFGAGARNVLGHRSDWLVCDDVVTEKNSATEEQRYKHLQWFTLAVETSGEKKKAGETAGQITVVGTMFHPHDLYASIIAKRDSKGRPVYKNHREDAIKDEAKHLPLWPAAWTWEELMDKRADIGALSFNKRYRNKPVDESEQNFKEEAIRGLPPHKGCLDHDRDYGVYDPDWRIIQAFDPAIGTSRGHKFCGHLVIGIPPEAKDHRCLIEIDRAQLTMPQQVDRIIHTALEYPNMQTSVIEVNAYQKGLQQAIEERCEQLGIPPIHMTPHVTGRNKQDPDIGLPSLQPLVEKYLLRFPYGNEEGKRRSEMLIQEMVEYPFFAYSDLLMALWFACKQARETLPIYKSFNRLTDKKRRILGRAGGARTIRNPYYENLNRRIEIEDGDGDDDPDFAA